MASSPASGLLRLLGMASPGDSTVRRQTLIKVDYDSSADLLYVNVGPIVSAANVEVDAGVYVRVNPETHEVVGLFVLEPSVKFDKSVTALKSVEFAKTLLERYGPIAKDRFAAQIAPSFAGTR